MGHYFITYINNYHFILYYKLLMSYIIDLVFTSISNVADFILQSNNCLKYNDAGVFILWEHLKKSCIISAYTTVYTAQSFIIEYSNLNILYSILSLRYNISSLCITQICIIPFRQAH